MTQRLKQNVPVLADNKTVRDACKMLRLVRGRKKMRDYTLEEWTWLVKPIVRTHPGKAAKRENRHRVHRRNEN